jgi:hypothetical protein
MHTLVMPGLDPGIHPAFLLSVGLTMDCRVKPGNDDNGNIHVPR